MNELPCIEMTLRHPVRRQICSCQETDLLWLKVKFEEAFELKIQLFDYRLELENLGKRLSLTMRTSKDQYKYKIDKRSREYIITNHRIIICERLQQLRQLI